MRTIGALLFYTLRVTFRLTRNRISHSPIKIGHRGAAGHCPENTFSSFHKAINLGVDYLEIDIQMTKDGALVIIHDLTVNRTTNGKGRVKDFTLNEIQNLDAGSWFDSKFQNEKIPTLCEFLDEFAGKVGLLMELKKPSLYPGIEEKVVSELLKRGLASEENDGVIVQSFDQNSLKRFHQLLPTIPLGILVKKTGMNRLKDKELLTFSKYASYVNPKITMVNKRLIRRIHHHGYKTFIWTVKKRDEVNLLKHYRVDGIISNFPDIL